jgi:hypothetical protein
LGTSQRGTNKIEHSVIVVDHKYLDHTNPIIRRGALAVVQDVAAYLALHLIYHCKSLNCRRGFCSHSAWWKNGLPLIGNNARFCRRFDFTKALIPWSGLYPVQENDKDISGVTADPALVQSTYSNPGNFELLVAQGANLVHYIRSNSASGSPGIAQAKLPLLGDQSTHLRRWPAVYSITDF